MTKTKEDIFHVEMIGGQRLMISVRVVNREVALVLVPTKGPVFVETRKNEDVVDTTVLQMTVNSFDLDFSRYTQFSLLFDILSFLFYLCQCFLHFWQKRDKKFSKKSFFLNKMDLNEHFGMKSSKKVLNTN